MNISRTNENDKPLRAVFLGSKHLGLAVFESLIHLQIPTVWSIVHPNDSEDDRSIMGEWRDTAARHQIDFHVTSTKTETREVLKLVQADIALCCGWYQLLDSETLSLFPKGAWGIHNSLLPRYRGGSPLSWSIINGDSIVGSTVFELNEGMDSGRVLHQVAIRNEILDDVGTLLRKLREALILDLPKKWLELLSGAAEFQIQNEAEATYCGSRRESDGCIDWSKTATEVHNFIRAQSHPYPGAFTYLQATKIRILRSRPLNVTWFGTPGQVLGVSSDKSGVFVASGQHTAVEVTFVEVEGQLKSAPSVLSSVRTRLGNYPLPSSPSLDSDFR